MKFSTTIRPTVYTGHGTYRNAMDRFSSVTPLCCPTYSGYGNYYGPIKRRGGNGPDYRKNKHYTLYVYKIDLRLLDILNMKIDQHQRYFRIVPKKK